MPHSQNDEPLRPQPRPLLGWPVLGPCLLLSALAVAGGVFYLERSKGRNGSRSAPVVAVSPSVEVSDTKRTPPIDEEPRDAAVVPRSGFDVDDIEVDDFDHALLWIDRMREVVAREDPKLTDEGARRLGEFTTQTAVSEETTSIELTESEGGRPLLTVGHGNGYSSMGVGLCFDLKAKHVMAGADSAEDVFPQPQPAWMGIEGTVVGLVAESCLGRRNARTGSSACRDRIRPVRTARA
jgi:hypothetical protein